jgi:hypothetical protein
MDEGQLQPFGGEDVLKATVDVLVGPALGRHGIDETDADPGEPLRHGCHIADDTGDTQVVPDLLAIGGADASTHFGERALQAEKGDLATEIEEALEGVGLDVQAVNVVVTFGQGGASDVNRQVMPQSRKRGRSASPRNASVRGASVPRSEVMRTTQTSTNRRASTHASVREVNISKKSGASLPAPPWFGGWIQSVPCSGPAGGVGVDGLVRTGDARGTCHAEAFLPARW